MKLISNKRLVASLLLSLAAASASAVEQGPYAFLNGGISSWSSDSATDDSGFGFKGGIGYRLNRNFSLEGGYAYLGKTDLKGGGDAKSSGFIADVVGQYPVNNLFDAYGRLGMYFGNNKATGVDSKTKMTIKFGLGAEYKVHSNATIVGEWDHYSVKYPGETATVNLFTAGVRYAF
jgi:OmpA-OmpF porin, OOP family